jgi:hypothetical protein
MELQLRVTIARQNLFHQWDKLRKLNINYADLNTSQLTKGDRARTELYRLDFKHKLKAKRVLNDGL